MKALKCNPRRSITREVRHPAMRIYVGVITHVRSMMYFYVAGALALRIRARNYRFLGILYAESNFRVVHA